VEYKNFDFIEVKSGFHRLGRVGWEEGGRVCSMNTMLWLDRRNKYWCSNAQKGKHN
jgi:hypothetical protein